MTDQEHVLSRIRIRIRIKELEYQNEGAGGNRNLSKETNEIAKSHLQD